MSLGDALLTFVSVFVAALLAFYLDGLRERRATRAWVREYLGFWRGMLDSRDDEGEGDANEAGVRRIETAVDAWLGSRPGAEPVWTDIDAFNVNATVRFTPPLLGVGAGVVPPDLMNRLFMADATAPALGSQADFMIRLYEEEVRPLVLARVVPLEGRDRIVVELYRKEFLGVFEQMRAYSHLMQGIRGELVRLGY
jgi:hypothetical protein